MPRTSGSAKARVYRMSTRIELCCSMRGVALVASEAPSWSSKSTSTIKTPVYNNYHPCHANEPVSKAPAEACPQVTYQRLGSAASLAAAGQHQCRTVLQVATDWMTAPYVLLLVMVRVGQLCTGGAGQHTRRVPYVRSGDLAGGVTLPRIQPTSGCSSCATATGGSHAPVASSCLHVLCTATTTTRPGLMSAMAMAMATPDKERAAPVLEHQLGFVDGASWNVVPVQQAIG